jgi:hypothetical protein
LNHDVRGINPVFPPMEPIRAAALVPGGKVCFGKALDPIRHGIDE